MNTLQLREELFREMNPLLDSEAVLQKMLLFVRDLVRVECPTKDAVGDGVEPVGSHRTRQVPESFRKLRGMVSISDEEIENDEQLAHIMER
ncbi:MAG: hypothetical protein K6F33_14040 [Bacteroidales bacterium]|nr:hypothetical protein [Bacteroidales bacterium]